MDGRPFANDAFAADATESVVVLEVPILGQISDDGVRVDSATAANFGAAEDDGKGTDATSGPDPHAVFDHGIGTNDRGRVNVGLLINEGISMDGHVSIDGKGQMVEFIVRLAAQPRRTHVRLRLRRSDGCG